MDLSFSRWIRRNLLPKADSDAAFSVTTQELTREHVIPAWVDEILSELEVTDGYPEQRWVSRFTSGGVDAVDRQHPSSGATVVVRSVCEDCNGGWMSRLEDLVRAKLGAMIRGHTMTLTPEEQLDIGTWSSKTAIAMEAYAPAMAVTTLADRQLVRSDGRPPSHHRVRLARRAEVHESLMIKTWLPDRGRPLPNRRTPLRSCSLSVG